ncbi:hypothetical protein [Alkalihalobacterium alkalinitrilicum]|uniref:hypothetical protein n=1 Tax=Alkalihalobacterium alkalinitrilicum TaxID=427920 RepID=UPI000995A133|nr:hypothetical protein [Alkalihalobacterium alkalinitrilicum]
MAISKSMFHRLLAFSKLISPLQDKLREGKITRIAAEILGKRGIEEQQKNYESLKSLNKITVTDIDALDMKKDDADKQYWNNLKKEVGKVGEKYLGELQELISRCETETILNEMKELQVNLEKFASFVNEKGDRS